MRPLWLLPIILTLIPAWGCTPRPVSLTFTGDILLSRSVEPQLQKNGLDYPYRAVEERFRADDITVGNLECPLTTDPYHVYKDRQILFRAQPQNAGALKAAGFDLLTLANNHTMDCGQQGLKDTLSHLDKAGIRTVGAGPSAEARDLTVLKRGNTRFGFLAWSVFPPEGYVHDPVGYDVARPPDKMLQLRMDLARKECDVLIVCIHWGPEFQQYPSPQQKQLAHQLIDAGADLIVGHHPHVIQSVEKYKGRYIFYSLGNFIFDRQVPPGTDEAVILNADFNGAALKRLTLTPVKIEVCQPKPAAREQFTSVSERLKTLCSDTGVFLTEQHGTLLVQ